MSEGKGRTGDDGNNVRDYVLTCRVEVLRRPRDFVQHHLTSMFMSRFGGNLLTADGDDWHRQRRVVAGTITERISKAVWQESVVQTESMIEEVFGGTGQSSVGKKAETKRMFDYMKKITINVLSGVGMGESIDVSGSCSLTYGSKEVTHTSS